MNRKKEESIGVVNQVFTDIADNGQDNDLPINERLVDGDNSESNEQTKRRYETNRSYLKDSNEEISAEKNPIQINIVNIEKNEKQQPVRMRKRTTVFIISILFTINLINYMDRFVCAGIFQRIFKNYNLPMLKNSNFIQIPGNNFDLKKIKKFP